MIPVVSVLLEASEKAKMLGVACLALTIYEYFLTLDEEALGMLRGY
jgi:hypothetical protein